MSHANYLEGERGEVKNEVEDKRRGREEELREAEK